MSKPRHNRCPCRKTKAKGCNRGECLCNRDAHVRGGHMLAIFCEWKGHKGEMPGLVPIDKLRFGGFQVRLLDANRMVKIVTD